MLVGHWSVLSRVMFLASFDEFVVYADITNASSKWNH